MESIEARQLINKIQRDLVNNGFNAEALVADLKNLRPFALEAQDPTLTKVIRLTYEHIEQTGTFDIPVPDDNDPEEELEIGEDGEVIEPTPEPEPEAEPEPEPEPEAPSDVDSVVESMDYLLSIMMHSTNKHNRVDLAKYRDLLLAY